MNLPLETAPIQEQSEKSPLEEILRAYGGRIELVPGLEETLLFDKSLRDRRARRPRLTTATLATRAAKQRQERQPPIYVRLRLR